MNEERLNALKQLPGLQGPALSIMMALLIAHAPLKAEELEDFTGYANQAVTRGLRKLKNYQAIVHLGRTKGYVLTPAWCQMALPLNHESHLYNHDIHDYNAPINGGGSGYRSKHSQPPPTNLGGNDRDFQAKPVDKSVDNTDVAIQSNSGVSPSNQTAGSPRPIPAVSGTPEQTAIAKWLIKAGVSPGYNWEKIMAMGHSESYVKRHVLTLLAHQEGIEDVPKGDQIATGGLIHRLTRPGWSVPERCEECLHTLAKCRCKSRIPAEYAGIIKR